MNEPSAWNDLAASWQADDHTVDVAALAAAAARGRRRQQLRFAVEVVASVAVAAFWGPQLVDGGNGVRLLGSGSIVFVLVWCVLLWRTLRGTWSSSSSTASAYLALQRDRLRAARRFTRVVRGGVVVMSLLLAVALPLLVHDAAGLYANEPARLVVGIAGFVGICAALWVIAARKARQLDATLARLPPLAEADD